MAFVEIIYRTAEKWAGDSRTLEVNQIGVESDIRNGVQYGSLKAKLGDGLTRWNDLGYFDPTGTVPAAFTSGAIPFADADGSLSQDSTSLFFDDAINTLMLTEHPYAGANDSWVSTNQRSALQIVNPGVPYVIVSPILGYFGSLIDVYTSQTSGSTQTSGIRVRCNNAATGGNQTSTGVESFVTNIGDTTGGAGSLMQAVEGIAKAYASISGTVYGGFFSSGCNTGSTTIGSLTAVYAAAANNSPTGAVTNATCLQASISFYGGAGCTITNAYGIKMSGWGGSGTVTNSYGIYIDTSIDVGATLKYSIFSLSTSPSVFVGSLLHSGTAGIGYTTGAGGTVTQITSRTTGVTLNKLSGAITLVSAAGSVLWQSFTVTNSTVAATDTISVSQKSGTDKNMIDVTAVGAGSFEITFATTGGVTTEQPVFNFNVHKGTAS